VPGARRGRRAALTAVLALLVVACGPASATSVVAQGLTEGRDGWRGILIERERTLPAVTLLDVHGGEVALASAFAGTPTLVFFGYTSCPDICPIHLAAIARAMETARISYSDLDVVFVSVDPERDTPERIASYLANFSSRMVGLHGDLPVIADALVQLDLGTPVVEGPDPRGEGDLIGHPAQVIGFDAEGRARRLWPFGTRRADWVADLPLVVEQWS